MFKDLANVIYDKDYKIIIFKDKVNIVNYNEVLIFEDNVILIKLEQCLFKIKGEGLSIIRSYNKELLIKGKIKTIEFG